MHTDLPVHNLPLHPILPALQLALPHLPQLFLLPDVHPSHVLLQWAVPFIFVVPGIHLPQRHHFYLLVLPIIMFRVHQHFILFIMCQPLCPIQFLLLFIVSFRHLPECKHLLALFCAM